ncbi:MAG: class I SAM-dependent methyltransferase [Gammaproteobacteria bacterium]|nr:class I SAM-dependent methyltransferase [Gammaproteobacteria bacterium]MDH3465184.1 class I SAM-dependent methyltransferase [Gammaproteobacteria bacterium]
MPRLAHSNRFIQHESGVWVAADTGTTEFGYSDGDSAETYLLSLMERCVDRSTLSSELQRGIRDWPSEYHVSSKRANLLRVFETPHLDSVLELGCGCGALSRFFGENGVNVDAVEGSLRRAQIAASRCRDLPTVSVVCGNFNDLDLPEHSYGAVFLVGVLEYAARFLPDATSSEQAVSTILRHALSSIKDDGIVVVAIENRVGLKYLLGSSEDHYAQPYVGVHNYPRHAGIKTFTRCEWENLLTPLDVTHRWCYPFPDYKLPELVLSQNYLDSNRFAFTDIESLNSRDYGGILAPGHDEAALWEGLHQNNDVGTYANSFLLILARDQLAIDLALRADFVRVYGSPRKTEFHSAHSRRVGIAPIDVTRLEGGGESRNNGILRHSVNSYSPHEGITVTMSWLRALRSHGLLDTFFRELRRYYEFLTEQQAQGNDCGELLNYIPDRIVIDANGHFRLRNLEWSLAHSVSPEFVLFRGLLQFSIQRLPNVRMYQRVLANDSVEAFIRRCFQALDSDFAAIRTECVTLEREVRRLMHDELAMLDIEVQLKQPLLPATRDANPELAAIKASRAWRAVEFARKMIHGYVMRPLSALRRWLSSNGRAH